MELIGSDTSPYVRRIRLLLAEQAHTYTSLDIYSEGRAALAEKTPIMKIPVLIDNERTLYDSRVIARYLCETHSIGEPLSWDQENLLSLIDGAQDSLITLLLSQRSGIDTDTDTLFYRLQKERISQSMAVLEEKARQGEFTNWNYPAICLFTLIDWASFRNLINLDDYPFLKSFRASHTKQKGVIETDPRG
ncbi:glutathione S-transferase family protein [Marinobacterium sediminicola]|uniref:Glutathione S-transferase n=1 Tax=Marinobacterium sediminicola TaxID=518898 RepID=A0ABY1S2V0_9GAMM|nr:glutathione S-transferase N-terminal domain-containing protein [Marinobacterium sediminicola]ULG69241.1 glutathione S-transferase N-terminal domain-containing protein [Marinobacterium sediminicola]SMR77589.1 glutathione S-transferase [Marinobacterium sediminicola]